MNKYTWQLFGVVAVAVMFCVGMIALPVRAEDIPPEYEAPASSAIEVNNPTEQEQLAQITQLLNQVLEELQNANEKTPALEDETASETPAPYMQELQTISERLDTLTDNTAPATPETAQSAFEKPFEEYTVPETLLMVVMVVAVIALVSVILSRFF